MKEFPVTPERMIGRLSLNEVQEFLEDLDLPSTTRDAARFKNLVFQFNDLELAIETVGGPVQIKRAA
ncbi:hypothetical protein Poly51_04990 [Rubripirellula tenax]|uniref:Uncharacterized protein n=1 Tax=Rubripirellula tenax TaxID=2528015 RepID=A0A5C6FKC4_9BACT|nr:hypothetical protein [Rubripirellula tenax]TWU60224.1 hypothetical protein Poly51_04990 [Rubripirellula tenax]